MMNYRVTVKVERVNGQCPVYKVGDKIVFEDFYLRSGDSQDACLHALVGMASLLSPFLHGFSAIRLGIGREEDVGYVQCPDPSQPYTKGGTVLFKLTRESIKGQ